MEKTNGNKGKIAILAVTFIVLSNSIISSILAGMAKSFPDVTPTGIQFVMTLGMVAAFLSTLVAGVLAQKISMKTIVLIALIALLLGGLMPLVLHANIMQIYVSAVLIGIGQGFCIPMVQTYVARLYEGKEKSQMFGWQTASKNAGAMILLIVAGIFAAKNWTHAYYVYFIVIPILVVAILFLPKGEPLGKENEAKKEHTGKIPFGTLGIIILIGLFCIGYSTEALNISVFLDQKGLGGATAASMAMSITTAMGIVAGIIFSKFLKVFKGYVFTIACASVAVGNIIIFNTSSLTVVYLASIFVGLGFGLGLTSTSDAISRTATSHQMAMSMSIYASSTTIGASVSPFVINGLTSGIMTLNSVNVFLISGIFMLVVAVLSGVWGLVNRAYYEEEKYETNYRFSYIYRGYF